MPRLVLAAQTIGTRVAASRTARSAAPSSPGGADHQRLAEPRRQRGVLGRGGRGGKTRSPRRLSRNSCSGLSPTAMPCGRFRPTRRYPGRPRCFPAGPPAGQGAPLGRNDVGDQHAADPAGASDHTDPGFRHVRLPKFGSIPARLLRRCAPRNDDPLAVIASEAKQSRSSDGFADDDFPEACFPLHRGSHGFAPFGRHGRSYTLVSRVLGFIRGHPDRGDPRRRTGRRRVFCRSAPAQSVPQACSPRAPSAPPSCRSLRVRWPEGGKPVLREFAEEAFAVLFVVLLGFVSSAKSSCRR